MGDVVDKKSVPVPAQYWPNPFPPGDPPWDPYRVLKPDQVKILVRYETNYRVQVAKAALEFYTKMEELMK